MKTEKITINRTQENPQGVEIDLVQPENALEERMMCFVLEMFLRDLKRDNRVTYELPPGARVRHGQRGTFVLVGHTGNGPYYEPPRPLVILGLRDAGGRFDLIHAPVPAMPPAQSQPAAGALRPAELSATATQMAAGPETGDADGAREEGAAPQA